MRILLAIVLSHAVSMSVLATDRAEGNVQIRDAERSTITKPSSKDSAADVSDVTRIRGADYVERAIEETKKGRQALKERTKIIESRTKVGSAPEERRKK
jgi:hypothetical protein